MKKLISLILTVALLSAAVRPAFAQDAPVASQGAPVIRVNFRSTKAPATVYDRGTGRLVCTTPCTADVPAGAALRVVLEGGEDEPHDFVVGGEHGPNIDIEFKRGGTGALVGGIVMTSIGGLLVVTGIVLLGLASALDDGSRLYSDLSDTYRTVGIVQIVAGIGVGVGGLVLLGSRSNEATLRTKPSYGGSRRDVLRSDAAEARPRDPMIPPPSQQLGWTFAF
jgi:hypothetical protein